MCDSNNMKSVAAAEREFDTANDGFEEDLALMTADYKKPSTHSQIEVDDSHSDNFDSDNDENENETIDDEGSENETIDNEDAEDETIDYGEGGSSGEEDGRGVIDEGGFDSESDVEAKSRSKFGVSGKEESTKTKGKRKMRPPEQPEATKKSKIVADFSSDSDDGEAEKLSASNESEEENGDGRNGSDNDETWEDIYGRIRAKDGSIVVVS